MKKLIRNLIILAVGFTAWVFIDLDYDSKDQDSIPRMLKWSPFSADWCMPSIEVAANDPRGSNLHGLNCPQIYKLALTKLKNHFEKSERLLTDALGAVKKTPGASAKIYFIPFSGAEMSIYNENSPSVKVATFSQEELSKMQSTANSSYSKLSSEVDRSYLMPWTQKLRFTNPEFTPTRFEVIGGAAQSKYDNDIARSASVNAPRKMMGDRVDDNPNAKPNRSEDAAKKAAGNEWQDENGFVHFPDGSVSNTPVD